MEQIERTGSTNPFNGIDVADVAAPIFTDWDGDLDLDLGICNRDDNVKYFERVSSDHVDERTGSRRSAA